MRLYSLLREGKEPPKHSRTVLIRNEFYKDGLTEYMVWKHIFNHKSDIVSQLKNKNVMLMIKTKDGSVVKRNDGGKPIEIKTKDDVMKWNSGRIFSYHAVIGEETDVGWIDIDPGEKFNFNETKRIVEQLVPIADKFNPHDVTIKYSGSRGFHILMHFDKMKSVDELRQTTKKELDKFVLDYGSKLVTGLTHDDPYKMRLDVSTLHKSGSISVPWSINIDTGLVAVPLKLNDLKRFDKSAAVINLPSHQEFFKFKADPNSTHNQIRWRLRDPKEFIDGSFVTWKYLEDIHEPGLSFVVGKLKSPFGEEAVQAIRFNRDSWSEASAAKWWEKNYHKFDKLWTEEDWKREMEKGEQNARA